MYKSYYFLNRLAIDLDKLVSGASIKGIFSQEKDKLIIQLENNAENAIEISVNHSEPYITFRDKFVRAKKNTVDIFPKIFGQKIESVSIANDDRVIKFQLTNCEMYFAIRGKFTNIYLANNDYIDSFKSEDESILIETISELTNKNYTHGFNFISHDLIEGMSIESIRSKFKFVGKELELEVKSRVNEEHNHAIELSKLLQELKTTTLAIYIDKLNNEIKIGFDSLKIFSGYQKEHIGDLFKTFNEYLKKKIFLSKSYNKIKTISSVLEKELQRTITRIEKLDKVIEVGPQGELLNRYANLILININKIATGAKEFICEDDFQPGNVVSIPLDKKLSPQKNAEKYFEKAKNSLIEFEKAKELFFKTKSTFEKLKQIKSELNEHLSNERMDQIMKELNIKNENQSAKQDDLSDKFKHYLIAGKYHVYVGKDSQNNDLLTTKFAKQNDLWFHARSVSGSHVILRVENTKDVIPKPIIKKAASLAAFHSKAKTAGIVPVSYTFKKYVVKRKGMPVGQVSLLKEDVLLVKPEIPDGCDYIQ